MNVLDNMARRVETCLAGNMDDDGIRTELSEFEGIEEASFLVARMGRRYVCLPDNSHEANVLRCIMDTKMRLGDASAIQLDVFDATPFLPRKETAMAM